jgi:hypothetical protein
MRVLPLQVSFQGITRLEDLKPGARVGGLVRLETTMVVDAKWHGSDCVELTYKRLARLSQFLPEFMSILWISRGVKVLSTGVL